MEIDTSLVASHVTVLKNFPYIGLMGYSSGENPLSYPEVNYQMVLQLIGASSRLVDYVILDCGSNMTNVFTPAAIESGDLIIRLLPPDLTAWRARFIYCAILIAVGCTIRGGEIGGLQWKYINFEKGTFHIFQAIDRISKKNLNLPKMEIMYQFPNLYPGTKTCIVLKQLKGDSGIRDVDVPEFVLRALKELKSMQEKMKQELGPEGYMDYDLVICQANGRPIMTEHLNAKFKDILKEMNDPEFNPDEIVFHSLRHTSATAKLFVSNGDFNSVKQAGGWASLEMLTRRYGNHSFSGNREKMAEKMDDFLNGAGNQQKTESVPENTEELLKKMLESNPDLLMKVVRSIQSC